MKRTASKRKAQEEHVPSTSSSSKRHRGEQTRLAWKRVELEEAEDAFLEKLSLRFKEPEKSIEFLVKSADLDVTEFMKNYWGKEPVTRDPDHESGALERIFSVSVLKEILNNCRKNGVELVPDRDIYLSTSAGSENVVVPDEISIEMLQKWCKSKDTIYLNQPQRFRKCLWALISAMESFFKRLVSCQAVYYEAGSDPAVPNANDNFILQLSGSSKWTISRPDAEETGNQPWDKFSPEGHPRNHLPDETKWVSYLTPGASLYIPRNFTAKTRGVQTGAHIVLSVARGYNVKEFLIENLRTFVDQSTKSDECLPVGLECRQSCKLREIFTATLRQLLESTNQQEIRVHPTSGMVKNFMIGRLPPFGTAPPNPEEIDEFSMSTKISLKNKEHLSWFVTEADDEEEDANFASGIFSHGLDSENKLMIVSSLNNERYRHMTIDSNEHDDKLNTIAVKVEYEPLLEKLVAAQGPVTLESLTEGRDDKGSINPISLAMALNDLKAITVNK